jgi:hypothetical protein
VHLFALSRRLGLQSLDRVQNPVPRLGAGQADRPLASPPSVDRPKKSPAGWWNTAGLLAASASGAPRLGAVRRVSTTGGNIENSGSQLQKQIARRKTTVHVTGLSGPTMNCITGLSLRLIIFPP